jgi:hypothetical protein
MTCRRPYPLTALAAVLLLAVFSCPVSAQSQAPSVAEAARRAREQKKAAGKPVRTLTDDDLPAKTAPSAAPVPGAPASEQPPDQQTADHAKPEEGSKPAAPEAAPSESAKQQEARKKAELRAALKQAKADLALAESELDILRRKAALDSEAFYSKTDYARDTAGKARLDADNRQVSDKKNDVDALKAKIAALEAATGEKP